VNSQPGSGGVDDSSHPPMTSSPKTTATRNSKLSTTQSRGRRRAAGTVADAFIPGAYRPGRRRSLTVAVIDTEVAATDTLVGPGHWKRRRLAPRSIPTADPPPPSGR
jgi:hypothetical protein